MAGDRAREALPMGAGELARELWADCRSVRQARGFDGRPRDSDVFLDSEPSAGEALPSM